MTDKNLLIHAIEKQIAELKEIGTEEDLRIFYIVITPIMDGIRDGSAVWKKRGAKQ